MTEVRWYRSWPRGSWPQHECHYEDTESVRCSICRNVRTGDAYPVRARVIDNLPRLLIDQYDYRTGDLPTDEPGFCLLEWDVALASEERREFALKALQQPNQVLVAPYAIYDRLTGTAECVHRTINGDPIPANYPACDTFGLGCIYLPRIVVARFLTESIDPTGMTDATFSRWVHDNYGPTEVDWRFHPQHLNGD